MDDLRIWLLGGFRVQVGAQEIPDERWRLRKARGVVKLLALAAGHRMHREQMIELLWPDLDAESADNQLRKALHEARRALDPAPEATFAHLPSGEHLALRRGAWVDVDAFEDAATQARRDRDAAAYERAIGLYGGPLLPEDRYEDWSCRRQEVLQADYLALLVEWARLLEARADLDRACAALRQVVAAVPAHEEAGAGLMRLHALAGRRQEALQEFGRLSTALREELAAAPAPATVRLVEQIRTGQAPGGDLDADLWEQVGDLRLLSGDAPGAAGAFQRATAAAGPAATARGARLHRKAAQAWLTDQRPEQAEPHLKLARALNLAVSTGEVAWRLAATATWLWQRGDYEQAQAAAEESLRLARAAGAADAVTAAQETLAIVMHFRGQWRAGLQAAIGRTTGGDAGAHLETVSEIHCCIGQYHLYGDGMSESVEQYARDTLALASARHARRAEAFAWCLLGETLLLQGSWDEAEACLQRSAELHAEFGPGAGALSWQRLAELAACRGNSAAAQACLRRAMAIATVAPLARHLWGRLFAIAALDAVERGEPHGAILAARSAAVAGARHGDCGDCAVLLNPVAAEAYAALGDRAGAARYAEAARRIAEGFDSSAWRAMAATAAGAWALADGDADRARAHHLGAAAFHDRARQPFWAARARLQAATAAGAAAPGTPSDEQLLERAAATFERLGAVRALARARGQAPAVGRRPPLLLPRPLGVIPVEELLVGAAPGPRLAGA